MVSVRLLSAFRQRGTSPAFEDLSKAWGRTVSSFDTIKAPTFPQDACLKPDDRERRDSVQHLKNGPFHALEDIVRHLKREVGKDVIVGRWCFSAYAGWYQGAYDIGSFLESDCFDFFVTQPPYDRRTFAIPLACHLPLASFRLHGKLFIDEFDLRTEGAIENWVRTEADNWGRQGVSNLPYNGGSVSVEANALSRGAFVVKVKSDQTFRLTVISGDGRGGVDQDVKAGEWTFRSKHEIRD